ncbi:MAG TPA: type II toxin-antitoxin system RelE/ParE family toxin, partial [Longimicrobium sp.]
LYAEFQRLAEYPASGPRRDELSSGLRVRPLLSYIILYYDHAGHVEIARIAHQRRDLSKLFQEEGEGRLPRR